MALDLECDMWVMRWSEMNSWGNGADRKSSYLLRMLEF